MKNGPEVHLHGTVAYWSRAFAYWNTTLMVLNFPAVWILKGCPRWTNSDAMSIILEAIFYLFIQRTSLTC